MKWQKGLSSATFEEGNFHPAKAIHMTMSAKHKMVLCPLFPESFMFILLQMRKLVQLTEHPSP